MEFSPTQSPVYGGGTLQIQCSQSLPECQLFLVFEGSYQRHITPAFLSPDNAVIKSVIPAHGESETVHLGLYSFHGDDLSAITTVSFNYYYDSAYYLAQFLVESVYNISALDDLELIRSNNFDLADELLDTLDDRLYAALRYLEIPEWWHILGPSSPAVFTDQPSRETLLHFAARLGLYKVASFLLDKPGSFESLKIPNRHGYLPQELAEEEGYTHLAHLLREYSPHFVKFDNKEPETSEYGIICYHDNNQKSFSTAVQRQLVQDVQIFEDLLRYKEIMVDVNHRTAETDWPGGDCQENQSVFEEGVEEKMSIISQKAKDIHIVMNNLDQYDNETHIHDSDSCSRSSKELSEGHIDKEDNPDKDHQHGAVYESAITGVHDFSQQLFRLRDYHRRKLLDQDVRKDSLSRFSNSCPSLEQEEGTLQPTIAVEEERHSSMLNLVNNVERPAVESNPDTQPQITIVHSQESRDQASIQICVNGVTLDGTEDVLDHSLNNFLKDFYGGNTPGVRRRSWAPNSTILQTDDSFRNKHNAPLSGKSTSLNSLDGDESDDGSQYQDAKEPSFTDPTGTDLTEQIIPKLDLQTDTSNTDIEVVGDTMYEDEAPNDTLARTLFSIKQELITPRDQLKSQSQEAEVISGHSGDSADEEMVSTLAVPHSTLMTKSLSTPSIPAAVSPYEKKGYNKDPKQRVRPSRAQFRRQNEVEEDDDENTNQFIGLQESKSRRKSELSLLDFLNESANYPDDQIKNTKKQELKDEKKRKTSVFSRLQSSYRTKKHKEKDTKVRSSHQYVSVSISNSTTCDVCQKTMANKPALRCENCLINVHENTCKEQIALCDKNRKMRIPPRVSSEGTSMANVALREKQLTSPGGVSGLRPTQSFKEKRSVSAPLRSQVTSAPPSGSSGVLYPSNPLSAIPDFSEPDENQGGQTAAQLLHRRSLPTQSKAINEEGESDRYGSGQELGPSNIGDTISESLESLDDVDGAVDVSAHYDEDFVMLKAEEPETWSETIEKKVLKKMNAKDVKRQDTIWELIQTERHHCRSLKILQRIHSEGILVDLQMHPDVVERLFPKLDDLIQVHMEFLHNLQDLQKRRPDRSIEYIGQTLVNQFEEQSEKMKYAYGAFCCGQKESVSFYKDLLIKDRKFANFIKRCNNHSLCQKREIPDFLLLVTQRPSKYLTLIEAILKRTTDKKDRENLSQSLQLSKDLLQSVDDQVHEHERKQRLIEIYHKMEAKAATTYKGRKFKKSDILSNNRKLIHEGVIGLKSARGKVVDATAVLLTDLIFFVQEANGKYNFFSQDNKSCVIPLIELLVREKSDTRDSRGIYLFSQNKQSPEMYEVVCNTPNDRQTWIKQLRLAAESCPTDEAEIVPQQQEDDEEQRREMEERSAKVQEIIEQLHRKDEEIRECCDEKNRLMIELLEVSSWKDPSHNKRPDSQGEEEGSEHLDALQAAIQEVSVTASRLTTMLQNNNGSHLSRHVSSVGEHVSNSYHTPPVPKRAETFHGFDSSFDLQKGVLSKRLTEQVADVEPWAVPVGLSQDRNDSDSELSSHNAEMSPYQQTLEQDDSIEVNYYGRYSSGNESVGDVSGSEALLFQGDHMHSISQLARSLHSIVHLTAKQGTAVETLRAQLAEANERINKLSAEVHDNKKGSTRHNQHNQLEELRNLYEQVLKQKQELKNQRERDRRQTERERSALEEERKELSKQAAELNAKKEELKKERERYQIQIDLWTKERGISNKDNEQALNRNSSAPGFVHLRDHSNNNESQDHSENSSNLNSHRRSASADFCQTIESDMEKLRSGQLKTTRRELPPRPEQKSTLQSAPSFSSNINSKLGGSKQQLPVQLLSAKNEQKTGFKAKQQIPSFGQNVIPLKLSASATNSNKSMTDKPVSVGNNGNMSQSGVTGHVTGSQSSASLTSKPLGKVMSSQQSKSSSASSLSGVLKLAEPGGKGRSSSLSSQTPPASVTVDKGQKSMSMDAGQHGNSQEKKKNRKGDNNEIYF